MFTIGKIRIATKNISSIKSIDAGIDGSTKEELYVPKLKISFTRGMRQG